MYTYKYPHPAVSVDCVVFGLDGSKLKLLLIQRDIEPFEGSWALPGGFVRMDESLSEAAVRELREETSVYNLFLEQLYSFGEPLRDPRERVITIAYWAIINLFEHPIQASSDARKADWFEISKIPDLAFDHKEILEKALIRLRSKIHYEPLAFTFLPPKFTLTQVQHLYEIILGEPLDKRNFRKKLLAQNILDPLDEYEAGVAHRAARLFEFNAIKYKEMLEQDYRFNL